jgi:hypothetical protein
VSWRVKNRFGRRYISDKELLDYASDLDLFAHYPPQPLLEFVERHGILNPAVRIRFPAEIARRWHKEQHPTETDIPDPIEGDTPRFKAANDLCNDISRWHEPCVYGERDHPLDNVRPECASFIQTRFDTTKFVPWSDMRAVVLKRGGREIRDGDSVRTCYHYWQVFALAAYLRSGVNILYDPADEELLRCLLQGQMPDSTKNGLYLSVNFEARRELTDIRKNQILFDAVGYFEDYRNNALQSHTRCLNAKTGRLSTEAARTFRARERRLARITLDRFGLKSREILAFIGFQCKLWHTAKQRSPEKVADEYRRNIDSTVDLYRLVSRDSYPEIVAKVGKHGSFKPILKEVFPDWLEEQRDLAERSLKGWIVPAMTVLPTPFKVTEQDVKGFCDWIEERGLFQLYWHFKRLMDIGLSDDPVSRSAAAAEAVGFANTVELLANSIIVDRGPPSPSPRGLKGLFPKTKEILKQESPKLSDLVNQHGNLTNTKKTTLKKRIAQIGRLKKGGAHAPVLRAILNLVAIRNEGSHLGLASLNRETIYELLESLMQSTLIIWKAR